ncbi:hypothetical protein AM587_10006195 [Phytophthora nicotianae]|uniref:Extradiol ring-cleavage dioxygenase class III enzyme subunit B domain-containing protein n=1 Tax=Phytophthora nicotianae TaxID=4792 RepID=A0A0W8CFI5_PHYNI|nr:hypothetical protein AM587_10006195 [Phytophthora nicotianae]
MPAFRHPVAAISHGPGPLWLISSGFDEMVRDTVTAPEVLRSLFGKLYPKDENLPKRILLVSAHFESSSSGFEISNAANPEMIYDYYGFSEEAYEVKYPAKGDPAFAQRVKEQLEKDHIKVKLVNQGTHRRNPTLIEGAKAFQNWLDSTLASDSKLTMEERSEQITNWHNAPGAKFAHSSPDHFLPFVVAAGAGMEEKEPGAKTFFGGWAFDQLSFANYAWGTQE